MDAFFDIEWADEDAEVLVSIAVVTADDLHVFYAEVAALPAAPTAFVAEHVYPQLRRGNSAMSLRVLAESLFKFILTRGITRLFCDHEADERLLMSLLGQAGVSSTNRSNVDVHRLSDPIVRLLIEDYFAAHLSVAAERHNALVDARVLRIAWMAKHGLASASWSPSAKQLGPR